MSAVLQKEQNYKTRAHLQNLVLVLDGGGQLARGQVRQGGEWKVDMVARRDRAQGIRLGLGGEQKERREKLKVGRQHLKAPRRFSDRHFSDRHFSDTCGP